MKSITTVAKHIVPVDRRMEFEQWVQGIDKAGHAFPGYLGMEHIHSRGSSDQEHFCVFRFDNETNLDAWMTSEARRRWLADERSHSAEIFTARPYSSLEFWFSRPDDTSPAPSDFKMTLVTFLVIWPLVHFVAPTVSRLISNPLIAEMLTVGTICALVTYLFMPIVTRLLGWWLFR